MAVDILLTRLGSMDVAWEVRGCKREVQVCKGEETGGSGDGVAMAIYGCREGLSVASS